MVDNRASGYDAVPRTEEREASPRRKKGEEEHYRKSVTKTVYLLVAT
jgi:hypothetical protein